MQCPAIMPSKQSIRHQREIWYFAKGLLDSIEHRLQLAIQPFCRRWVRTFTDITKGSCPFPAWLGEDKSICESLENCRNENPDAELRLQHSYDILRLDSSTTHEHFLDLILFEFAAIFPVSCGNCFHISKNFINKQLWRLTEQLLCCATRQSNFSKICRLSSHKVTLDLCLRSPVTLSYCTNNSCVTNSELGLLVVWRHLVATEVHRRNEILRSIVQQASKEVTQNNRRSLSGSCSTTFLRFDVRKCPRQESKSYWFPHDELRGATRRVEGG
mmetsp:Transcript_96118/g.151402  ORF Transcript_96118/g.151402 Transcript_96118/m.151402 type:complete len:272 (-) Transcript_96118:353-1168(-)